MTQLTTHEAKQLSSLNLAYIGDCEYEMLARTKMLLKGNVPVNRLHKSVVALVCACAQSKGFAAIEALLTEDETAVYKRGRNANGSTVPKNADPQDYRRATGVEALFGFLYLTGQKPRASELFDIMYDYITEKEG